MISFIHFIKFTATCKRLLLTKGRQNKELGKNNQYDLIKARTP
jgi:hypothetical protein